MKCEDCKYFFPTNNGKTGQCRRYPPTLNSDEFGEFPIVYSIVWCGEFKEIPVRQYCGRLE